jgi:hypothetical protein
VHSRRNYSLIFLELICHLYPEFDYLPERIVKIPIRGLRFHIIEQGIAEIPGAALISSDATVVGAAFENAMCPSGRKTHSIP